MHHHSLPIHPARGAAAMAALAVLLAGCSPPDGPAVLEPPALPPGLAVSAFQLTIDVGSGEVTVSRPGRPGGGPSLSLVGDDVVRMHPTSCTWTALAGGKKRCSFGLALENRLSLTDVVPARTFPRPPADPEGVLVFPFSAAALGVSGGTATPSPEWDNPPMNFFNDFGGCTSKSSDCYRSETYPGALYAGQTSEARTVGFDVDRNAHTVVAYVLVAGDLRDNPVQEALLPPVAALCGTVEINISNASAVAVPDFPVIAGPRDGDFGRLDRGFCAFALPDVRVEHASLRLYQGSISGTPYDNGDVVVVDEMAYGPELDTGDYDLAALDEEIGVLSTDATVGLRTLDVTAAVQNAIASGRPNAEFRIRFRNDAAMGRAIFDGPKDFDGNPGVNPPRLLIRYRLK